MRYNSKAFAHRGIAQLVEQRSPKPRAEGSNPSAPAKAPADLGGSFLFSSPVLPPSDEGGGKPEGLDGGRDTVSLRKGGCPEYAGCEFSPSVACGDSSLVRGSQAPGGRRFPAEGAKPCGGQPAHQKSRPVILDKAAPGCYIDVSKNGCQCKWRSSLVDFSSVEIAAYRSGGRLFLMSEGRYDQRRKTDEHQRICKHICICDHIAHPLFDRGRFCGNAGRHRTPQKSRFCGGPLEFHRFPASELPKIGRRHSPAGAARDLPRAARAAQCRREPVFRRLRRFD